MRRAWLLLLLSTGCSLVNDPADHLGPATDAGPAEVRFEDFCGRYAEAFCQAKADCCESGGVDIGACSDAAESECEMFYGSAFGVDGVTYSPTLAAEALASGQVLLDACDLGIVAWATDRRGFLGGLEGEVEGGEVCDPMDRSELALFVAHLTCQNRDHICQQVGVDDWRCGRKLEDGRPCRSGLVCDTARCPRGSLIAPGTCGPGEAAGSPCNRSDECASGFCTGTDLSLGQCVDIDEQTLYCN
ncbi:MAG: hypothetical protein VYE22_10075 [Myxococcota bacterium]|nr:hypothetical protein [Myxococcota bacterium]